MDDFFDIGAGMKGMKTEIEDLESRLLTKAWMWTGVINDMIITMPNPTKESTMPILCSRLLNMCPFRGPDLMKALFNNEREASSSSFLRRTSLIHQGL